MVGQLAEEREEQSAAHRGDEIRDVLTDVIRRACQSLELGYQELLSGAGHDAMLLAHACPTGMIFVPCKGGVSHNETEDAAPDDLAAGARVLTQTLLELAEQ